MASTGLVSAFRHDGARQRFLRRYEWAFRKWPVPREELDVRTRFGSVHVHRSGADPGTPVVLLHGLSTTSAMWYPNVCALAEQHTVFAVDMLGEQGRSVHEKPIRDTADASEWLDDVFAGLGLDRAHLIGCSLGGWNAANYAVRYPNRLTTLTLLDPVGLATFHKRFFAAVCLDRLALVSPRPLAARLSTSTSPTDADILRLTTAAVRDFKIRLPRADVLDDDQLRSIVTPALVLLAERSTAHDSREVRARLRALLPSADVEILAGVGHNFPMTRPELVNGRVLDFLSAAQRSD
ncbi:alpha/beta fold hydrolase [Saccharopolyspora sp. 5N708]|uniref:alpha/beta fold hydrolase n=1 Tax=Saccharopolyspora sp. 5N708 TaxID=3457424 RepID=UPI003FD4D529